MTDEKIAERIMVGLGEDFPADPASDDTWCLSSNELRTALLRCAEMVKEFQPEEFETKARAHAAVMEIGLALASEGHKWTPRQRVAWEKAERLLR